MLLGTLSLAGAVVAALLWGCAFTWAIQKVIDKASSCVCLLSLWTVSWIALFGIYWLGAMFLAGIAWPWFTALQVAGGEGLLHKLHTLFLFGGIAICAWSAFGNHGFSMKDNSLKSGAVSTLGLLCFGLSMLASVFAAAC